MHTTARNPRLRWAAALIVAALIILATLFATPQGRTLAQNILHFFNRSDSSSIPLVTPTRLTLSDVTPGRPLPTLTATPGQPLAFASQCGDQSFPKCSLEQIRALVAFPVMAIYGEMPPSGLNFIGATGGPDQVWLVYRSEDLTRSLFLLEGTQVEQGFQGFKIAADTTVESVQVGDAAGEYVKGAWNDPSGSGNLTWDPSRPDQYLRWMAGGIHYEMNAFSNPDNPSYWSDKTGQLSLARSLTATPATPTPELVNDNLTLAQAEALAGFHLLAPDKLQRGEYTFSHASYSPLTKTVCLDYGATLSIAESATAPLPALNGLFPADPKYGWWMNAETLKVGGGLGGWGMLIKGTLNINQFCVNKEESEVLQLQTQDLKISIYAQEYPNFNGHDFVTRLDLVSLAESMTGVQTIPDDQLDPEYLLDVKDAEAFAGFHILQPTKLFPDEAFSYFSVTSEDLSRRVTIMHQNNLAVSQTILPTETLESILKADPNVFQKVTVRGQPGLLWAESGNSISICWFENGIEYQVYGVWDNQPVEVWLAIADSLK